MNQAKLQAPPTDIGELSGTYAVVREIGRGGMGAVVMARHRRAGHLVAIKIASAEHVDAEALARFTREARLMARLSHPNIVKLYDVRPLGAGRIGIVMEYVRGVSLAQMLTEQKQLPFQACVRILQDVGEALAHAHAGGVIHRDVKPHNVLVDKESGRAKLSDFGIATGSGDASQVTTLGGVVGTPAYMSPEQIDALDLDGRSDIYSLGIVGWQVVSGEQPWAGESLFHLLFKQKHEPLPSLATLRPDTPSNLLLALEGALEKDPALRWARMEDMLEQLESPEPTAAALERQRLMAALAPGEEEETDESTVQIRRRKRAPRRREPAAEPGAPGAGPSTAVGEAPSAPAPAPAAFRPRLDWLRTSQVAVGAVAGAVIMLGALQLFRPASAPEALPPAPREAKAAVSAVLPAARERPTADARRPATNGSARKAEVPAAPVAAPPRRVAVATPRAVDPPPAATPSPRLGTPAAAPRVDTRPGTPATALRVDALARGAGASERRRADALSLTTRARGLVFAGYTRQAAPMIDSALALDQHAGGAYLLRARVRIARGQVRDAWTDIELAARTGARWEALSLSTLLNARQSGAAEARALIAPELRAALTPRRALDAERAVSLATALVVTGDTSTALTLLELAAPDGLLPATLADPLLAPLHSSSRFTRLRDRSPR